MQVLLSGGVDSTVCTALLNKALNQDQVIAVHIDNGFMRKRESQSVEEALTKLGINLKGNRNIFILVYCKHLNWLKNQGMHQVPSKLNLNKNKNVLFIRHFYCPLFSHNNIKIAILQVDNVKCKKRNSTKLHNYLF